MKFQFSQTLVSQTLAATLAALLLTAPAWADGGGAGGDIGINIEYFDSQDDATDDDDAATPKSGTFGGTRIEPLEAPQVDIGQILGNYRFPQVREEQFSTTTKLRGEVVFSDEAFGSTDEDLSGGGTFGSRTRLNFDSSFTGEDRLRVRLQARDPNGFAKQGKAPTVRTLTPPAFGQREFVDDPFSAPKYSFNIGARWELRAEYNQDAYSDGYVTGERVPGQRFDFQFSPEALFGSDESVRYVSPTVAGFILSSEWDAGSGREVPITPAGNDTPSATTDQTPTGIEFSGSYGTLRFNPFVPAVPDEIKDDIDLIPNRWRRPQYQTQSGDVETSGLQDFSAPGLRGGPEETKNSDDFVNPRRYRFTVGFRF